MVKIKQIHTTDVAQLNVLEMLPGSFVWIKIGRISRQPFQMNVFSRSISQICFDLASAMNRRSVPDHQQLVIRSCAQTLQEVNTVCCSHRIISHHGKQLPLWRNGTHHRDMVAGLIDTQNRRTANRRIGSDRRGQQVETRFIHKSQGSVLKSRSFFISSHSSLRQRVIASSSRCVARSIGICGVHFNSFSKQATWDLQYVTPNSHSITLATRRHVQTPPRNPYASAPCDRNSGIAHFCSSVKSRGRPVWGCASNPPSPCSRTVVNHWLTAPFVAPNACAICSCVHPCRLSSTACSRRDSALACLCDMRATMNWL